MKPPLPIIGVGLVTAAGRGVEPAWEALCAARSSLAVDAAPELAGFPPVKTARCARIDPGAIGADRRAARLMRHHVHMLLAAVHDAIVAVPAILETAAEEVAFFAGMDSVDPAGDDLLGAIRGSGDGVCLERFFREGMDSIPPLWPLGLLNAIGFCQVAIQYRLRGENAVFSAGAEATARAICEAAASVRLGKARLALAAGASGAISARMLARAALRGAWPAAWGLGEGAGVVCLGRAEDADAGGICGWLKGHALTRALERGCGLARALEGAARAALAMAGLAPGEVDLVVLHGEGRDRPDEAEAAAVSAIFPDDRPCRLATKGVFGHLWGGSPALDVILALRALAEGVAPPSPGVADARFRRAGQTPGRDGLRNALVLVQGFDGVCAALVVGKDA